MDLIARSFVGLLAPARLLILDSAEIGCAECGIPDIRAFRLHSISLLRESREECHGDGTSGLASEV